MKKRKAASKKPAETMSFTFTDLSSKTGWICPRCGKCLAPWIPECNCHTAAHPPENPNVTSPHAPVQPYVIPHWPPTAPYVTFAPPVWTVCDSTADDGKR